MAAPARSGGAANLSLLKFLARQLGVKVSSLSLSSGSRNRRKVVLVVLYIEGLTEAEARGRLEGRLAGTAREMPNLYVRRKSDDFFRQGPC